MSPFPPHVIVIITCIIIVVVVISVAVAVTVTVLIIVIISSISRGSNVYVCFQNTIPTEFQVGSKGRVRLNIPNNPI